VILIDDTPVVPMVILLFVPADKEIFVDAWLEPEGTSMVVLYPLGLICISIWLPSLGGCVKSTTRRNSSLSVTA
jgi:hypothetical protein